MHTRGARPIFRHIDISGVGITRMGIALVAWAVSSPSLAADPNLLSPEYQATLNRRFDADIAKLSDASKESPKSVALYSSRGDAYFFRGKFAEAVADYEKMVELDPTKEADHWRKGIAYFYAERYQDAAHQFEIYHNFDDVDRENGIWRFLSQTKAYGIEKAREGLLKYKKDDREPFPAVYDLFAGKRTPDQILDSIRQAEVGADEREKRLFYAELYIGLNDAVRNRAASAREHLGKAVMNSWGPRAGYGPNFMWHVGRVHYDLLERARGLETNSGQKKISGQK